MPELPEVETTRRALARRLDGARFTAVVQRRPDLRFPLPERLRERLEGRQILGFRRRAKFILADLDGGEEDHRSDLPSPGTALALRGRSDRLVDTVWYDAG